MDEMIGYKQVLKKLLSCNLKTFSMYKNNGFHIHQPPSAPANVQVSAWNTMKVQKELVNSMDVCTRLISMLLFPSNSKGLYEALLAKEDTSNAVLYGLFMKLLKAPTGSIEKRVLRSFLFVHLPGVELQRRITSIKGLDVEEDMCDEGPVSGKEDGSWGGESKWYYDCENFGSGCWIQ